MADCYLCKQCAIDAPLAAAAASPQSEQVDGIFPTPSDITAKQRKPNCTRCRGCSAQLQPLKAVSAFGRDFSVELGASPEWIFTAGGCGWRRGGGAEGEEV